MAVSLNINKMNLLDFPDEILLRFFNYLHPLDQLVLAKVCKKFSDLSNDRELIRKNLLYLKIDITNLIMEDKPLRIQKIWNNTLYPILLKMSNSQQFSKIDQDTAAIIKRLRLRAEQPPTFGCKPYEDAAEAKAPTPVFKLLIKKGIKFPVDILSKVLKFGPSLGTIKMLVEQGASPKWCRLEDAIMCSSEVVEFLIQEGVLLTQKALQTFLKSEQCAEAIKIKVFELGASVVDGSMIIEAIKGKCPTELIIKLINSTAPHDFHIVSQAMDATKAPEIIDPLIDSCKPELGKNCSWSTINFVLFHTMVNKYPLKTIQKLIAKGADLGEDTLSDAIRAHASLEVFQFFIDAGHRVTSKILSEAEYWKALPEVIQLLKQNLAP